MELIEGMTLFSRKKHWHTSSPDVQFAFCKSSAQGNRGNSSTWVRHDFFGPMLVMLLEEHFQVRAKLALPRQAFPCLAQSQETVNISSCHGVVNSLFCVCFSIYHHSPHLLCSAFTPRLVLHLMPQSFIPAAQKFVSPLISILCSAATLPKLFLGGWYNPRPFKMNLELG